MKKIYGLHLMLDGYVCDNGCLEPSKIVDLFDILVEELKMCYLMKPVVMRVPIDKDKVESDDDEGGWSGICQITTSHMSIHTWPLRNAFMMDIFSCKEFDAHKAEELVVDFLKVRSHNTNLVERNNPF